MKIIHFGHQKKTGKVGGNVGSVSSKENDAKSAPNVYEDLELNWIRLILKVN